MATSDSSQLTAKRFTELRRPRTDNRQLRASVNCQLFTWTATHRHPVRHHARPLPRFSPAERQFGDQLGDDVASHVGAGGGVVGSIEHLIQQRLDGEDAIPAGFQVGRRGSTATTGNCDLGLPGTDAARCRVLPPPERAPTFPGSADPVSEAPRFQSHARLQKCPTEPVRLPRQGEGHG